MLHVVSLLGWLAAAIIALVVMLGWIGSWDATDWTVVGIVAAALALFTWDQLRLARRRLPPGAE